MDSNEVLMLPGVVDTVRAKVVAIVVVAVVPKELTEVLLRRVVLGGRVSVLGVTASTVKLIVMAGDVIVEVVAGDLHVRTELVVVVVVTVVVDVVFVINVVSLISVASSCVILSNTCSRSGHRPFLIFFHAKSCKRCRLFTREDKFLNSTLAKTRKYFSYFVVEPVNTMVTNIVVSPHLKVEISL